MKTRILLLLMAYSCAVQGQKAYIDNIARKEGSSLAIAIVDKGSIHRYSANCGFRDVTVLPDSTKIRLIGELLSYTSDTSLCFTPVQKLSNYYMGKKMPASKRYNMQIDALVLINYIAFSSVAFTYNPFPLLFDKESKTEICCSGQSLDKVIDLYRKWYEGIRRDGFVKYKVPLWGQRIEWFGTIMGRPDFDIYPKWENSYNCRTID